MPPRHTPAPAMDVTDHAVFRLSGERCAGRLAGDDETQGSHRRGPLTAGFLPASRGSDHCGLVHAAGLTHTSP